MASGRASKNKGARGELLVRDLLRDWWRQYDPEARFERTPGSGGWDKDGDFGVAGDLVTNSVSFPFSVEVKWRESVSFPVFFDSRRSPVWAWWRQCLADAASSGVRGREPMLWARKSRMDWVVLMSHRYVQRLGLLERFAPDHQLDEGKLTERGIEFVELPVVYYAKRVLKLSPKVFAVE